MSNPTEGGFSHVDENGTTRMVNVGQKPVTQRTAVASAKLRMLPETARRIQALEIEKGDVLSTARLSGIMAAKRTSELIPLCHQVPLDEVSIEFTFDGADLLVVQAMVQCHARTGVEMEALVAASNTALTIYDMCKAIDREMVVECLRLDSKHGGRGGSYRRAPDES